MDFYNSLLLPSPFRLSSPVSVFPRCFFSFLKIISKPHTFRHFHRHRTFAMVIRGIAVKNHPDHDGGRRGEDRWEKGRHTHGVGDAGGGTRGEEGGGGQQPSITSLFTDFSAGRHVDICNYRTEAVARPPQFLFAIRTTIFNFE